MRKFPVQINWVNIGETAGGHAGGPVAGPADSGAGSGALKGQEYSNSPEEGFQTAASCKLLRNIKGIIFDFDGTLFDNKLLPFYMISAYPPDLLRIFRERQTRKSFAGSDYSTPEEYYRAFFNTMAKACHRSPEKIKNWYFNRYMPRMARALRNHYKLRPGVTELFRCFDTMDKPSLPQIAIYSDYPILKERMEAVGLTLSKRILLYGPESFGAQKPAARPFLQIAGELGTTPEETLVIGDREDTDGLGAYRAGMRFFCLETGRKRYFRLDPYRNPKKEEPQGPSLVMYAGNWDELNKLLIEKYGGTSKNPGL